MLPISVSILESGTQTNLGINIEIVTTFDSLDEKSILDTKNEALELILRFLMFNQSDPLRGRGVPHF